MRSTNKVVVLSPHRDDAAFSCALVMQALLAADICVRIVTVCTQSSYAPYASFCHSSAMGEVTALRKREDDSFIDQLLLASKAKNELIQSDDLAWLDAPERWNMHPDDTLQPAPLKKWEVASLAKAFASLAAAELVLAPLAVGSHVDHQLVKAAALAALPVSRLLFYEDLPYAARVPAEEAERTAGSETGEPWSSRCYPLQSRARAGQKHAFAFNYASQIDESTAREISNYSDLLGGRERLYGATPTLDLMDELLL